MENRLRRRWILFAAWGLLAAAAARPAEPSLGSLEGDWEAVISSPRRPWILLLHFKPAGAGWAGSLSLRGLPDFALADVRAELPRVHFRLPPELDSRDFDGVLAGGEIVGHVLEDGRETPARLQRVPVLPRPGNRLEAWRQDLDYAGARLAAYDRSFPPSARQAFQKELARLRRDLHRKNDAEILVALSHAVALADNAHTRMRTDPTRNGTFSRTFPIRIWRFSDGAYVVRAATEYRRVLRARVVAVEGHGLPEAEAKVASLFAGNRAWASYLGPIYLTKPDILYGLGLIRSPSKASFVFEDPRGSRFTLPIRAEPLVRDAMAAESWQEISPLIATGKPAWATALAADPGALPLYLRHPDQPYWFEYLAETGTLYFQFNRSGNAEKGPSLAEFGQSFLAFARDHPVESVVIDLRLNAGGDLDVAKGFIRSLAQDAVINRPGRLFVITGHCTFSAGLYHAAQLKQYTKATFVGEPVGDRLDFWAEGGEIALPNSQAVIRYSNGFHRYSGVAYPDREPYYEELSIPTLAPEIPAPTASEDYFSGRDPALEAIEAIPRPSPVSGTLRPIPPEPQFARHASRLIPVARRIPAPTGSR